jgi:hypothetical protein
MTTATFPFNVLGVWIRKYNQVVKSSRDFVIICEGCNRKEVDFVLECYLPFSEKGPQTECEERTVWKEALLTQLDGTLRWYDRTWYCRQCAHAGAKAFNDAIGVDGTTKLQALLKGSLTEGYTVVIASHFENPQAEPTLIIGSLEDQVTRAGLFKALQESAHAFNG